MEEFHWKRIFYNIFIILYVICLIFGHVTSASTNSDSVLEESQVQTIVPTTVSLTSVPLYDASTTSASYQIAPTSKFVIQESQISPVSDDALPQSATQSVIERSQSIEENNVPQSIVLQSDTVTYPSEPTESSYPSEPTESSYQNEPTESSGANSVLMVSPVSSSHVIMTYATSYSAFVPTQISVGVEPMSPLIELMSSDIAPTSSDVIPTSSDIVSASSDVELTSSVIEPMTSNLVSSSSVIEPMASNLVSSSSVIEPMASNLVSTSSVIEPMISNLASTSSVTELMSSDIAPTQSVVESADTLSMQSNVESIDSNVESSGLQSKVDSTLLSFMTSSDILPSASQFETSFSEFVSTSVIPRESEIASNSSSIVDILSEISVIDVSSEIIDSTDKSSFSTSFFDSVVPTSVDDSSVPTLDTSYSYVSSVSTQLPESFSYSSQTSDLLESGITVLPTFVSDEILSTISSDLSLEITSSLATHSLSLDSLILESSTSIAVADTTSTLISPSSVPAVPSASSSTLVNQTLPVPEKRTSGLTKGGKVALGICIPIIIILVIAAIVFFAYRRRYRSASWKLTDVVSYRPWSYSNATYYDDESTLIVPN